MGQLAVLVFFACVLICLHYTSAEETVFSKVLTPSTVSDGTKLKRQSRSYYDYRYGVPRPIYDRLDYARYEYDRPRCGRCDDRRDDRDDRDDDYERRDRYDDDRRGHRPTSGNRYDKKNYDSDEDRYNDRKNGQKNGTEEDNGDKNNSYDDKDSGSRRGGDRDRDRDRDRGRDRDRDRRRGGDRNRYDDRDRYRSDYYDRFLRDPYRDERRDYYDYERRPLYERYPAYDDPGYSYPGHRRYSYEDRGYDDPYGGYGPSAARGPHDSFRPWDETYRGQAGWDAGGRGYYFASGRPESGSTAGWARPEYSRPQEVGYQGLGYSTGHAGSYRDPYGQSSSGYGSGGAGYSAGAGYGQAAAYGQSFAGYGQSSNGYGQGSGWHSVGERRPYRDESGVKKLDSRDYNPGSRNQNANQNTYEQSSRQPNYSQTGNWQNNQNYQQSYSSSSTTPGTSYLFQREDQQVTAKLEDTTKAPS